jgi:general secretion pathway protein D
MSGGTRRILRLASALLTMGMGAAVAQQAPPTSLPNASEPAAQAASAAKADAAQAAVPPKAIDVRQPSRGQRRRAAKLYLQATKLFEKQQFQRAFENYTEAAELDPANIQYGMAEQVARGHVVMELIQTAAKARTRGDTASMREALTRALQLDPQNEQVALHLRELGDEALAGQMQAPYAQGAADLAGPEELAPAGELHSFHVRSNQRGLIQQVFKAYGIAATVDDSVRNGVSRLDIDDVNFADATRILGILTNSFYVAIDAHRAVVARDTREFRQQFMRNVVETVYLAGLTSTEMTDMGNMARNVFEIQQTAVDPTAGTLTLRGAETTLNAFNSTFRSLMEGSSQVLLDVNMIQLAHTHDLNTGVTLPQQVTAFNVYAEEQSILNANQALVQQIISSGLAAPGDTLAILGILLASGQVSSSLFSNGVALFGGGLTLSGLSPRPISANLSINSSDSRQLDQFQMRLQDGEAGTLRNGSRYPIQSSQLSAIGGSGVNIPGLNSAGNSSSLSSIISSLAGSTVSIPQIQYQDLGLTLKATPKVMRSNEVALTIDMKISALAGSSINGLPVLANRAYSGVVTVRQGEAAVLASEVDKQESRALSGIPGLTEIPGMNNITETDKQSNYATLLIIVTPHVIRSPHAEGRSTMVRIEKNTLPR